MEDTRTITEMIEDITGAAFNINATVARQKAEALEELDRHIAELMADQHFAQQRLIAYKKQRVMCEEAGAMAEYENVDVESMLRFMLRCKAAEASWWVTLNAETEHRAAMIGECLAKTRKQRDDLRNDPEFSAG